MNTNDASPLVGEAVGDALGMAFETQEGNSEALLQWDGKRYLPSEYHGLRPGQWTDDTMMAKLIAESIVICGGFYPSDIAERYRAWYRSNDHRGMGKATKAALGRLDQGVSWAESGTEGSEGNGSAMRAAPIGFFFNENPEAIQEFATIEARITHRSLEAEQGSIAVAIGTALLVRKPDLRVFADLVAEHLGDCQIRQGLRKVTFYQQQGDLSAAEALRLLGTRAHVVQTVPSAFAAFLLTKSFEEAVQVAIRAGGDTDTTAAITGALAGTYYGFNQIPQAWRDGLEDLDRLRELETWRSP